MSFQYDFIPPFNPLFIYSFSIAGSKMWLWHSGHGYVLDHGGHSIASHCSTSCCPFPNVGSSASKICGNKFHQGRSHCSTVPFIVHSSTLMLMLLTLQDTNLVFMGGLMVAVSIEHSDLHKRIALRVLLFMGSKPRWCVQCSIFSYMSFIHFSLKSLESLILPS